MDLAFFARRPDGLLDPLDMARSSWSDEQAHGVSVAGALGYGAEQALAELGRPELRPARLSVDLFRPTRMSGGCRLESRVVREGPRLCLVDVTWLQDDVPTARAGALFLRPSETPVGTAWTNPDQPEAPPTDVAPETDQPHVPFMRSDAAWSQDFRDHQNAGRKTYWNTAPSIVRGEPVTPFQAAAASADGTSLAVNWSDRGVQHINADVTLTLARLPIGVTVGLRSLDRLEHDGLVVGSATMFDRQGPFGTTVVTAMANTRRAIDMGGRRWEDDPRHDPGA